MDGRCKHDLLPGQCAACKPPPPGVRPHGYRTDGGSAYHNDPACDWLLRGQRHAAARAQETHPAVQVVWADVRPGSLEPCEYCCTPEWLARRTPAVAPVSVPKPCLVRDGDEWYQGQLSWEAAPREDGLWWAKVRYRREGQELTVVRNQNALRPRE
ncbi:hypothetical protein [Amycolatopsis sp. NPDC098790]|uniref:hypothetical protein n=1 Tax=Amycolatopsis sp. NPDC098790 TaxID=3363939 RepID=UPI003819D0BF